MFYLKNKIIRFWIGSLIICIVIAFISCIYWKDGNFYEALFAVSCSSISAGILSLFLEYKSQKEFYKAKDILLSNFKNNCTSLVSLLYWCYEEFSSSNSVVLESSFDKCTLKRFFEIINKANNNHKSKNVVPIREVFEKLNKYFTENDFNQLPEDKQKNLQNFLNIIVRLSISIYLKKLVDDISYLRDAFLKIDRSEYIKFENLVSDKMLISLLNINGAKNLVLFTFIKIIIDSLKSYCLYLDIKQLEDNHTLSLELPAELFLLK